MELSQKSLKSIEKIVIKTVISTLDEVLDKKLDKKLDEKLDAKLAAQTKELEAYADEQTEMLARIIKTTVAQPLEQVRQKLSSPFSRQF